MLHQRSVALQSNRDGRILNLGLHDIHVTLGALKSRPCGQFHGSTKQRCQSSSKNYPEKLSQKGNQTVNCYCGTLVKNQRRETGNQGLAVTVLMRANLIFVARAHWSRRLCCSAALDQS